MNTAIKAKRYSTRIGSDALAGIAEGLAVRMPGLKPDDATLVLKTLHELLDGQDEQARNIRKGMQYYLIEVAEHQLRYSLGETSSKMLTTEEAAELMQCSRPYVAMLIDNKKLDGATLTAGGHRRVPETSVRAWIEQRNATSRQSDYRAAAADSSMYDIPESAFVQQDASKA